MLAGFAINPIKEHRVVWHGGNSTMIHFEVLKDNQWIEKNCQSFMEFPKGMSALHAAMQDFYQSCLEEHELNKD